MIKITFALHYLKCYTWFTNDTDVNNSVQCEKTEKIFLIPMLKALTPTENSKKQIVTEIR